MWNKVRESAPLTGEPRLYCRSTTRLHFSPPPPLNHCVRATTRLHFSPPPPLNHCVRATTRLHFSPPPPLNHCVRARTGVRNGVLACPVRRGLVIDFVKAT
ncbi:hypothetical protein BgiMline_004775 [Biomphalaria glabrata]